MNLPTEALEPDREVVDYFVKVYPIFYRLPFGDDRAVKARDEMMKRKRFFVENFFWIRRKEGGTPQLLIMNEPQLRYWRLVQSLRRGDDPVMIIILKARQMGISTIVAADFFSDVIFTKNVAARIMAHDKLTGELLFNIYRYFWDNLDPRVQPTLGIGKREGTRLVFREGSDRTRGLNSEIEVLVPKEASSSGTGQLGRGSTSQYLHISELAFWENPSASLSSLMHSFADKPNSKCIIESTAVKAGDFFYNEWKRAVEGKSDFHPLFIPWFVHSEYQRAFRTPEERESFAKTIQSSNDDEYGNEALLMERFGLSLEQLNWRRRTIRNKCHGDIRVFQSEYPSTAEEAFQYAKGNFLNGVKMSVYIQGSYPPVCQGDFVSSGVISKPVLKPSPHGYVAIWSSKNDPEPHPFAEYVIGVDVSENLPSRDYSAAVVIRRLPLKVVARLRGNDFRIPLTEEFCEQLALLARYFNDAKILVEANSIGQEVIRRLREIEGYTRLITLNELTPEIQRSQIHFGIKTSSTVRKQLMDGLKAIFEGDDEILCYDKLIIEECMALSPDEYGKVRAPKKGIVRPKNEPEAGYYDDLAFALAIAYYAHARLPAPKSVEAIKRQKEMEDMNWYEQRYGEGRDPSYQYLNYV